MAETCPYEIRVPARVIVGMAGELASAYVLLDGRVDPDDISPLPDEVTGRLTDEQQAKVTEMAFLAVDIACFARTLGGEEGAERLRSRDYVSEPTASRIRRVVKEQPRSSVDVAVGAIRRYGQALQDEAVFHRRDPELRELREHMTLARRSLHFRATLGARSLETPMVSARGTLASYYKNLRALPNGLANLNITSDRYGTRRENIPDVLRGSLPLLGFEATLPLAVFNTNKPFMDWRTRVEGTDEIGQMQAGGWYVPPENAAKATPDMDKLQGHSHILLERVNTGCPALPPVPGVTKVGALKMLGMQEIDILQEQGAWG